MNKTFLTTIFLAIFATVTIFIYLRGWNGILFVDAARYADVARSMVQQGELAGQFTFPSSSFNGDWRSGLPPMHILFIALSFFIFGVNDLSIILESSIFFVLSTCLIFLISEKLFNKKVALFASITYVFTPQLLDYARDGASESIFIFELLLITYLILSKKNWALFLASFVLVISFFTKLQGYIFGGVFLIWIVLSYKSWKKILMFSTLPIFSILLSKLGLITFGNFKLGGLPLYLALQQSSLFPGDDLPRSGFSSQLDLFFIIQNIKVFLSKIFYNLYNFYKSVFTFTNLLPPWTSPFIVITYILSIFSFLAKEDEKVRNFRWFVLLMVMVSFILAAATSPHIRYAHYVIPFIIILAIDFIDKVFLKLGYPTKKINLILALAVGLFMLLPFLGEIILDNRFKSKLYNTDKPHIHKVLGIKLGELTQKNEIVITNLDSWGSWYGDRKTILIPTDLSKLENLSQRIPISSIFLTDYHKDNEDHPLIYDWQKMFDGQKLNNKFLLENFDLEKIGTISAQEVYENKEFSYKIWKKKDLMSVNSSF